MPRLLDLLFAKDQVEAVEVDHGDLTILLRTERVSTTRRALYWPNRLALPDRFWKSADINRVSPGRVDASDSTDGVAVLEGSTKRLES